MAPKLLYAPPNCSLNLTTLSLRIKCKQQNPWHFPLLSATAVRYNSTVLLLALDTCDARGSVAILRDSALLGVVAHETSQDYSSWLLPAVSGVLRSAGLNVANLDAFAVASGPGSFTGLRVGLTSVKAWSEVYAKPIAAVSRLEALAVQAQGNEPYVAAFVDAHRSQVFGALYRRVGQDFERIGEDTVLAPDAFLERVAGLAQGQRVAWISMDPERLTSQARWPEREKSGERVQMSSTVLAPLIGQLGYRRVLDGKVTDALGLEADYVRRSDAEVFWKAGAGHAR